MDSASARSGIGSVSAMQCDPGTKRVWLEQDVSTCFAFASEQEGTCSAVTSGDFVKSDKVQSRVLAQAVPSGHRRAVRVEQNILRDGFSIIIYKRGASLLVVHHGGESERQRLGGSGERWSH